MIQCPYCKRSFGSEGSYRVHKHRFHKGMEYKQPVFTHEVVQQPTPEPVEAEKGIEEPDVMTEDIYTPLKMRYDGAIPEPQPEQPKPQEPEHYDHSIVERGKDSDGDGLAILGGIGAIAVVIILALLGKK